MYTWPSPLFFSYCNVTVPGAEDDYTNNLRSSSYAMLKPSLEPGHCAASHMSGPQSLMPLGHQDHRMPVSSSNTPASLFQSLPYIGNNQVSEEEATSR